MKKQITIKELREQLERMEALGLSDHLVCFRDENSMDWEIKSGVIDNDDIHIVLG